jgi:predicted MFS family arabinose efflux permease
MTSRFWTANVILLASAIFCASLGQGLQGGVSTNFLVQELGLDGQQILWLAGIREAPGLVAVVLAALIMRLPLARRAAVALLLMALGFGCYALVHSYLALIVVALVASVGFHNWFPVSSALSMGLVERQASGRIQGRMRAVTALAGLAGMGLVILLSGRIGLRPFFLMAALALVAGAVVVLRLPNDIGASIAETPRMVFKRRYWLYYVLVFFEGSRTQVFFTFGSWVLVEFYQVTAAQLATLMIVSRMVGFLTAPRVGDWIDRLGERRVLTGSYLGLAAGFVGYATFRHVWLLAPTYVIMNFLLVSRIGLDTYVNRITPREELSPTLAAGVSINHVTSVGMTLIAGSLVNSLGYQGLCLGAAAIILLSVPFALSVRRAAPEVSAAAA